MQKTTIAGTVSQVRELKQVGDKQVFNFSVAVSNGKNQDGSWRDSTFWDVSCWDKRAESISRFLTKGTKIVVIGRPSCRAHEGKAYMSLAMDEMTLLGGGDSQSNSDTRNSDEGDSVPF